MPGTFGIWILFGLCLGLSFLFSGMEAGVFALSRLRIRRQLRAGQRSAQVLLEYLENPEGFLWTILVGNTAANLLILGWLIVILHHALHARPWWFILAYVPVVFLFYTLLDFLPKMLFRRYPTRLCLGLARPFRLVHLILRPIVALVEWVSNFLLRWRGGKAYTGHLFGNREEFRSLMQESGQALSSEERVMISRVLDLQALTVRQVMAPLVQAATISIQAKVADALAVCKERNVTRVPVWETREGARRIIGLLNLDQVLFQAGFEADSPIAACVKPALYLEEDLRLEVALRRMQRGGHRLAIVLGRDRREIGIVSLQDVLKVVFGEVSL